MGPFHTMKRTNNLRELDSITENTLCESPESNPHDPDDKMRISTHVDGNPSLDVLYAPTFVCDSAKDVSENVCDKPEYIHSTTSGSSCRTSCLNVDLLNNKSESLNKYTFHESQFKTVFSKSRLPNSQAATPDEQTCVKDTLVETYRKAENVDNSRNDFVQENSNIKTPFMDNNFSIDFGNLGDKTDSSHEDISKIADALCGACQTDNCVCRYFTASQLAALHRLDGWDRAYVLMSASRCTSTLILVLP